MARTIYYIPKIVQARTEYRDLDSADQTWIINQMLEWLVKMSTLSNTANQDERLVRNEYWRKRRASLPRGITGQNTPESMVSGILDNMLYSSAPQRDFSQRQCDAIEDISNWMNALDSQRFQEIRFQIRVI